MLVSASGFVLRFAIAGLVLLLSGILSLLANKHRFAMDSRGSYSVFDDALLRMKRSMAAFRLQLN